MEYVLDNNDRIGCSTVYGMSLIHFMYKCKTLVDYYFNPAQLIMFKSSATKGLSYDSTFEKFKMDTDYTMQMITKNEMFPIIVTKLYSFLHFQPISKKVKGKGMVQMAYNNSTAQRTQEEKERVHRLFYEKWKDYGVVISKSNNIIIKRGIMKHYGLDSKTLKYNPKLIRNRYEHYANHQNILEGIL
jgi:hypothetical protein